MIGTVTNLAARLCSAADRCRILASRSVVGPLGREADVEFIGDLSLKGFLTPVATFSIRGLRASHDVNGHPGAGRHAGAVHAAAEHGANGASPGR